MISRGEVGLIVAGYGLANGLIGTEVFSAAVVMVLATTMITPPLLRMVFPRRVGSEFAIEETIAHRPESLNVSVDNLTPVTAIVSIEAGSRIQSP
jgi:hypothetical protein